MTTQSTSNAASEPIKFDPWEVGSWYVSGVLTGYRVVRYGPRGAVEHGGGFAGDCYKPGSFTEAKRQAATLARRLNGEPL
jgi:hypothetical protein